MGSHYISVGKLKVDSALLDIACPAAGYGGTPPDPASFCPLHGYALEPGAWVAPVTYPDPIAEQILLLCDDLGQGVISVSMNVSAGSRKFEILPTDFSSVIFTATFAASYTYTFPTQGTGTFYVIRLTPATAGEKITLFQAYSGFTGYNIDWRIIQAKFNTPNMVDLSSAFQNMTCFKECIFFSNMNLLTKLSSAFAYTAIEFVTWPSQMNLLNTLASTFSNTNALKRMTFPSSLPALTTMTYCFTTSSVIEVVLPTTLGAATNISFAQLFHNCVLLEKVTYPTSCDRVSDTTQMHYQNYKLAQDIVLPPLPYLVTASSMFYNCYSIPKITFSGASNLCTSLDSLCYTCKSLTQLSLPTSMNALVTGWGNMIASCNIIQKVTLPNSMTSLSGTPNAFSYAYVMKELTTCAQWSANQMSLLVMSQKIIAFQQPTLRVSYLKVGNSANDPLRAPFTSVEIDWANSTYVSGGLCLWGNMPTAELNRIFTALPTVVGKTIDVRGNPGYATCTKTIATAKGWTVS